MKICCITGLENMNTSLLAQGRGGGGGGLNGDVRPAKVCFSGFLS